MERPATPMLETSSAYHAQRRRRYSTTATAIATSAHASTTAHMV